MSNEVIPWSERLKTSAKEVAALERPSLSAISLRGGILKYMDTPTPGNKMDVVVIASAFQKRYYDKPFDPNKPANPVCFALSLTGEDMVPSEESTDRQNGACSSCPMNEWGSDPKGGRGKACKDARRLVLIPAAALQDPENAKKAEMALLTLPVMSGGNWANYVNSLAAEYERPPWAMLTEVSVVPDPRSQFKVKFAAVGMVAEDYLELLQSKIEQAQGILLQPYDDSGSSEKDEAKPKEGKKY